LECQNEQSNSGAACNGRVLKWDTVIEQKANELGRFLTGKSSSINFVDLAPNLERQDNRELRSKILALSALQAHQLGIGRSTLYYLQQNAKKNRFRIYERVITKLNTYPSDYTGH
jgi:hypothetical protein